MESAIPFGFPDCDLAAIRTVLGSVPVTLQLVVSFLMRHISRRQTHPSISGLKISVTNVILRFNNSALSASPEDS
jgi:hypothetical protein